MCKDFMSSENTERKLRKPGRAIKPPLKLDPKCRKEEWLGESICS
jgi:hypothetical protein